MQQITSFSAQIRRTVIGTAVAAVVVTVAAMLMIVVAMARNGAQERANTLASTLSATAPGILALKDAERGRELLSALSASRNIVGMQLLDTQNAPIAEYLRPGTAKSDGGLFDVDPLPSLSYASAPVSAGGDALGAVKVAVELEYISDASWMFVTTGLVIMLFMIFGIWLIARPLEKRISRPLLNFSIVTRRIRETKDFSLRVPMSNIREVRGLTEDFNAMLQEVQRNSEATLGRNSELSQLAYYDALTNAANRSLFLDRMGRLVSAHNTTKLPFAVIAIDLDYFKQLNDTLGHQIGDRFLKQVVINCKACLRPDDTFARMGGDEFIALVGGIGEAKDAVLIAKKLSRAVEQANSVHSMEIKCSASIGVGIFPTDGRTADELLARVDAAMYRAKSGGRNCIFTVNAPERQAMPTPSLDLVK
jgi:diguanylate cyclase